MASSKRLPIKFPEGIQNNIFAPRGKTAYQVYMSDIRDLEAVINRNTDEAIAILKEVIDKRMTTNEKRKLITDQTRRIDEELLKAAEQALPKFETEITKLETPEELERTAEVLRREAKRKREETQTSKEKAEEKRIKEEKKRKREEARRLREKEEIRRIEKEAEKRARGLEEAEKLQIEEEAKKKAQEEILSSPQLLQEFRQSSRCRELSDPGTLSLFPQQLIGVILASLSSHSDPLQPAPGIMLSFHGIPAHPLHPFLGSHTNLHISHIIQELHISFRKTPRIFHPYTS